MGDRLIDLIGKLGMDPNDYRDSWEAALISDEVAEEGAKVESARNFAKFIARLASDADLGEEWEDDEESVAEAAGLTETQRGALQRGDSETIERELAAVSDPGDPTIRDGR